MATSTYSELLRDPRWQKKRLEIMQRDGWKCTACGATDANLQVHHKQYIRGRKPWEYAPENLATLCEGCHVREGFRVISVAEGDDGDPAVYFRVTPGILVDDECNNGASCWIDPNKLKPNARVAIMCTDTPEELVWKSESELSFVERQRIIKSAIECLLMNCGRST